MKINKVPKNIVKEIDKLKRYHALSCNSENILYEWIEENDLYWDENETNSIRNFKGEFVIEIADIHLGCITGEKFKKLMEE